MAFTRRLDKGFEMERAARCVSAISSVNLDPLLVWKAIVSKI